MLSQGVCSPFEDEDGFWSARQTATWQLYTVVSGAGSQTAIESTRSEHWEKSKYGMACVNTFYSKVCLRKVLSLCLVMLKASGDRNTFESESTAGLVHTDVFQELSQIEKWGLGKSEKNGVFKGRTSGDLILVILYVQGCSMSDDKVCFIFWKNNGIMSLKAE